LDCYKTQKKELLVNAKIFTANLGGKFRDICYINPTLLHFWQKQIRKMKKNLTKYSFPSKNILCNDENFHEKKIIV